MPKSREALVTDALQLVGYPTKLRTPDEIATACEQLTRALQANNHVGLRASDVAHDAAAALSDLVRRLHRAADELQLREAY